MPKPKETSRFDIPNIVAPSEILLCLNIRRQPRSTRGRLTGFDGEIALGKKGHEIREKRFKDGVDGKEAT
jgi:hypothetical protein